MMEKQCSRAGFFVQCLILTERSFLNMYRDVGYYWLRLGIYIALGLGLGTVFHNVGNGYNSINVSPIFILTRQEFHAMKFDIS